MRIHVSYNFAVANIGIQGFGDGIVNVDPPSSDDDAAAGAWLINLKELFIASLEKDDSRMRGVSVVIMAWNVMDWGAIE